MRASGCVVSPSGASSVRGVKPSSRSSRTSSYAIARCAPRSPAMPYWPRMAGSVWSDAPCSIISHRWRFIALVCAFGHQSLVTVLTRCGLRLPTYFLADEKHSRCLTDKVYLPTIVSGRVLWHLGYTTEASAAAFTQSYQVFQRAAVQHEPWYRVKGVLTDGFDSTIKSLRTLFPGVHLGTCLRHALLKLPKKLAAVTSPVRKALRPQFHALWYRARQRTGLRVFALGQRLRHFVDHVTATAGPTNGERVRRWVQDKKAGW